MDVDVLICKKKKRGGGVGGVEKWRRKRRGKKYIVIAVRRVVSYTVHSSMTAGNAGLDVALCECVYVCVFETRGGGGLPFANTCYSDYHSVLSIQPDSYFPFLPF